MEILHQSPLAMEVSTDWRQQVLDVIPEYNQVKGRRTGISRTDIATTTKRFYDGIQLELTAEMMSWFPLLCEKTRLIEISTT